MKEEQKIDFLLQLISCFYTMYYWKYDDELQLLSTNCPEEFLREFPCATPEQLCPSDILRQDSPILLSSHNNLMWVSQPQWQENHLASCHILGPFFLDDVSLPNIEATMHRQNCSQSAISFFLHFCSTLPVLSLHLIFEYAIMLHYCITGNHIIPSDIIHREKLSPPINSSELHSEKNKKSATYLMELELLRMVREGDLGYSKQLTMLTHRGEFAKLSTGEPVRHLKNSLLCNIVLFSRAAIEGGLSPELSLSLSEHYIQSVESCKDASELLALSRIIQDDYIQRVHRHRIAGLSKVVIDCCSYIELHLEDSSLSRASLAQALDYSESYLSRRFKQELNTTINDYIVRKRLEQAKEMLRSTDLNIQDISDRLQFCSQSYFSSVFKRNYGLTPKQWRAHSTHK